MSVVTWHGYPQVGLIRRYRHNLYIDPFKCDDPGSAALYDVHAKHRTVLFFRLDQHIRVGDKVQFLDRIYLATDKLTKYTGHHAYDRAEFALKRLK